VIIQVRFSSRDLFKTFACITVGQIVSILPEAGPWDGGYICMVELALLVAMRVAQLSNDFQIIYALAKARTIKSTLGHVQGGGSRKLLGGYM